MNAMKRLDLHMKVQILEDKSTLFQLSMNIFSINKQSFCKI